MKLRTRSHKANYSENIQPHCLPTAKSHPNSEDLYSRLSIPIQGRNNVMVKKSTKKGGGWGLFAKIQFKEGDIICTYEGKIIFERQRERFLKGKPNTYCAEVGVPSTRIGKTSKFKQYIVIDSADLFTCYGRFINDPFDEQLVNCKFKWDESKNLALVVATGPIEIYEEIFNCYSEKYWEGRNY